MRPGDDQDGHAAGGAIVAAARALLGAPFRAQGRSERGVDCLGLVILACARAGLRVAAPAVAPALRGTDVAAAEAALLAAGAVRVAVASPGDLLLAAPAARQVHLAIATATGVVEAHAGLGRVVERPRTAADGWVSAWRLPADAGGGGA